MKRLIILGTLIYSLIWMTGCASLEPDLSVPEGDALEIGTIDFDSIEEDIERSQEADLQNEDLQNEDLQNESEVDDSSQNDSEDGGNEASEKENVEKGISEFYYNQFSDEEKRVYVQIWEALKNHEDSIQLKGVAANRIEEVFWGVLRDHPEIYWAKSYQGVSYRSEPDRHDITPVYFYSVKECGEIDKIIQKVTEEYLAGVKNKQTDYDKILYTFEFLVERTEYGGDIAACQNIESVFVNNKSVCGGYAKATKYLLDLLNIECIYVYGNATSDEGTEEHAWNIVKCEGDYCLVDTTWGDPIMKDGAKGMENINYDYMLCDDEFMLKSHTPDTLYKYPACTTKKWNYFVVNNMYYEEFDKGEIVNVMKTDIANRAEASTFKFENKSDYQKMSKILTNSIWVELGGELADEQKLLNGIQYQLNDKSYMCKIYWDYK